MVGLLLTPCAHHSSIVLVGLLLTLCAHHSSLILVSQLLTPCAVAFQHDVSFPLSVYILFLLISISALPFFLPVPSNSIALHLHRGEVLSVSHSFPELQ